MMGTEKFRKIGYNKTRYKEFISYKDYFENTITQEVFIDWEKKTIEITNQEGNSVKLTLAEFMAIAKQIEVVANS